MTRNTLAAGALALGAIGFGGLVFAQQHGGAPEGEGEPDLGAMLMEGLRSTEGCLGVDAGQFMSGKNAIIAWFKDKESVINWYDSRTHRGAMAMTLGAEAQNMVHAPMKHVEHDGPIMVVAAITFTDTPQIEGMNLPISQISIELFAPLPGGAHVNGRLAPAAFEVAHMKDYNEIEKEAGYGG